MADDSKKDGFIDRLGPALTSGLIIAGLSALSLGSVALRDLVTVANVDIAAAKSRLDDHEERLRTQESRAPRLSPDLAKVVEQCAAVQQQLHDLRVTRERNVSRIEHLEKDQDELCVRLQACQRGNSR